MCVPICNLSGLKAMLLEMCLLSITPSIRIYLLQPTTVDSVGAMYRHPTEFHLSRMKILLVSHAAPYPPDLGPAQRMYNELVEMLKRQTVAVLSLGTPNEEADSRKR